MDNWVTFLIVNVLLVIVLGVFTNLATPWIKSSYERRIFISKKNKIEKLIREYRLKKILNEKPNLLVPITIREFLLNFSGLIVTSTIALILFFSIAYFLHTTLGWFLYGFGFLINTSYSITKVFFATVHLINDSIGFSDYAVEAKVKIKKLGGNLEDLDKEESKE